MKCKICKGEAEISLRAYNLRLCRGCFLDFFIRRVRKTIEEFRMFSLKEKILLAVSGGKDSLSLWDVLNELGYRVWGLHIDLGITSYRDRAEECVREFAQKRGLPLKVVRIQDELGADLGKLSKVAKRAPCRVCGMMKRYIMNREAQGFDCIVTGHNLDDEASTLLGNLLNWQEGFLARQAPLLLENQTLKRKAKPLCLLQEDEIRLYAQTRGIRYIKEKCPFSRGATSFVHKEALRIIEKKIPTSKLRFYKKFIKERYFKTEKSKRPREGLVSCQRCGYLTVTQICNFCKLKEKVLLDSPSYRDR